MRSLGTEASVDLGRGPLGMKASIGHESLCSYLKTLLKPFNEMVEKFLEPIAIGDHV